MTRHIADSNRTQGSSARAAQFARIEASERPHAQSKVLQKKPQATDPVARTKRFLEIERRKA